MLIVCAFLDFECVSLTIKALFMAHHFEKLMVVISSFC